MRSVLVVFDQPSVEVRLQLVQALVDLFAESDLIELFEYGLVESFADAIGLRTLRFGSRVINVLQREVQLELVLILLATILGTSICENTK